MKFSKLELRDLFFAWIMISIAFAIAFAGGESIFSNPSIVMIYLVFSLLTAGISFLFHEIMHKYMAQKYHFWAEFRAFYPMLFLAILFSFAGFIFAAPGAVFINGRMTKERNGKISLAGPMTNIVLGILFLIPFLILQPADGVLRIFFILGLSINAWLAIFNLLPFEPFDGKKVYEWNRSIYYISMILAIILFVSSFIL